MRLVQMPQCNFDIIRMWQDPKISMKIYLSRLSLNVDESYFYINGGTIEYEGEFWISSSFDIKPPKEVTVSVQQKMLKMA